MSSWINKILLIAWSNMLLCYLKRSSSRRKKQNKLRKITRKQFSWKKIYWAERRFEKGRYENASISKKKIRKICYGWKINKQLLLLEQFFSMVRNSTKRYHPNSTRARWRYLSWSLPYLQRHLLSLWSPWVLLHLKTKKKNVSSGFVHLFSFYYYKYSTVSLYTTIQLAIKVIIALKGNDLEAKLEKKGKRCHV